MIETRLSDADSDSDVHACADSAILNFCAKEAGPKVSPLGNFLKVDPVTLQKVQKGAELVLNAQRKILEKLLTSFTRQEVLRSLGIPPELESMIAALDDPNTELPMMRLDLLPTPLGELKICEFNVGSSLGAAEAFEFARVANLSDGDKDGPYECLAIHIAQELEKLDSKRLAIVDWSTWQDYGMFNLDTMVRVIEAYIPNIEVMILNELDVENRITDDVLLFRIFMAMDALADPRLVHRIFNAAGKVLTDFSGDLFGSKAWLHLLHDNQHQAHLEADEIDAIVTFLPFTRAVTQDTLPDLVVAKDRYFFKAASDFGGHGVIDGRSSDPRELRELLSTRSQESWVAQERVDVARAEFRLAGTSDWFTSEYVLGSFKMGELWSGCMVRTNPNSSVINIARGASVGWSS